MDKYINKTLFLSKRNDLHIDTLFIHKQWMLKMKRQYLLAASLVLAIGGSTCAFAHESAGAAVEQSAPANAAVKSPDDTASAPLAAGHNSFTMEQARARIKKAGYTDVSTLTKDTNGLWNGEATLNGRRVPVSLDYKGDIATQ